MARSYYARKLGQIVDDALRLCRDFRAPGGDGRKWRFLEVVEIVNDVILTVSKRTGILDADAARHAFLSTKSSLLSRFDA